jgi:sarcosine oxidase subunit alpha
VKRLAPIPREWIDRSRQFAFAFEGRPYSGFAGDTITSALAAADVRVLGRSFKYHRPRGVLSFANHDVNALVQWDDRPNVRADVTPLVDGMRLVAVNTDGGLDRDRRRFLDRLSPFLPVGFYYKAFHDRRWFPRWEAMFRTLTGLGRVSVKTERERTPKRYDVCDVLVIGAGPSGLSAALAAADTGARVAIVDENARAGGSGTYALVGDDDPAAARVAALVDRCTSHPRVSLRSATTAAGYYADHWVPLVEAGRITKMRARAVVVAAGAFEQPAVFRGNDLPGVMLGSAAQRLLHRYAVAPMRRAVVLVANRDGYRVALDLLAHGIAVAAVADLNEAPSDPDAHRELASRGVAIRLGHGVYEARADHDLLREAVLAPLTREGELNAARTERIACDGLVVCVGWAPAANLLSQAGAPMRYDEALAQFVPRTLPEGVFACGRVNGVHALEAKLADGERAGLEAASALGFAIGRAVPQVPAETQRPSHPYPIFAHPKGKNFVDFDEDLQLADFGNAVQEGFDNIELLKRYTTVGMGPSQGKHSNMNAVRILARLAGQPIAAVGTTTARPFFHPVPLAHLAGRGFTVERETPLHARHEALGAVFMLAGQWRRPEYYAVPGGRRLEAIREEVLAVRNAVGLIDVGTLGKIEIHGPDAASFLERVYTGRFANMSVGSTRYGLMVDEAGTIIDDGVVARFGDQRYYFTTTTSGSATVYRELTRLNTMWRMQCGIVNVTGHRAAVNLAGPKARDVLGRLTRSNVSEAVFPYLAARELEVAGIAARVLRIGFVGELGYEIHVAHDRAATLWDALMDAGAAFGIRPFGVEAQRLLRLEKGHFIVGQDTDGLTNPIEAGCGWAVKMDKPFFVGQRSLAILAKKPLRQALAGIELLPGEAVDRVAECHLVIEAGDIAGRVTSVAYSPTLARHIGLAMLAPDLAQPGRQIAIRVTDGALVAAKVVRPPFYDADGKRQKLAAAA